jgi:outer membrane protein assembly factor BamB
LKKFLLALILVLVFSGCGSPEVWRCYGGDGSRSLCARRPGPDRPRLAWVADLEGANPGAPAVDSHHIYVPHSGGSVTKLSLSGEVEWRFDSWVSQGGDLPPHLSLLPEGRVLVSCQGAQEETFLLNRDGAIIMGPSWLPWTAATSPGTNSQGYLVVCHQYIHDGAVALCIYGTKGGEVLWRWDFAEEEHSFFGSNPVVLEDGRAYVFIETTKDYNLLLALDAAGGCLWQQEFPAAETRGVGKAIGASEKGIIVFGTPRVEDISRVYSPGSVYAVGADGEILWEAQAGGRVEQLFIAPGLVVANVLRSKLLALDFEGRELWQYSLAGWESNGVMDSRGRIYLAGVCEGTVCLRAVSSKGRDLWQLDTKQPAQAVSCLALANGSIYLATDNGKLLAVTD